MSIGSNPDLRNLCLLSSSPNMKATVATMAGVWALITTSRSIGFNTTATTCSNLSLSLLSWSSLSLSFFPLPAINQIFNPLWAMLFWQNCIYNSYDFTTWKHRRYLKFTRKDDNKILILQSQFADNLVMHGDMATARRLANKFLRYIPLPNRFTHWSREIWM